MSEDNRDGAEGATPMSAAGRDGNARHREVEHWLEGLAGMRDPEEGSAYDALDAQIAAIIRADIADSRVSDSSIARVSRRLDRAIAPRLPSWRFSAVAASFAAGMASALLATSLLLPMLREAFDRENIREESARAVDPSPQQNATPHEELDEDAGSGRESWSIVPLPERGPRPYEELDKDLGWESWTLAPTTTLPVKRLRIESEDPRASVGLFANDLARANIGFTFESDGVIRTEMPTDTKQIERFIWSLHMVGSNQNWNIASRTPLIIEFGANPD